MVTNFCSAEGSHDTLYTITLLNFKISCFYFIYVMVIRLSAIRLSAIRLSAIRLSAIRLSGYPLSGYPLSGYPLSGYPLSGNLLSGYPVIRYPAIRYPSIRYPSIRYPSIRYPGFLPCLPNQRKGRTTFNTYSTQHCLGHEIRSWVQSLLIRPLLTDLKLLDRASAMHK